MEHGHPPENRLGGGEVIDFDEGVLDACSAQDRAELLEEAELLASVFAPRGDPSDLIQMAAQVSRGGRDAEERRHHGRRLAAALRRLAKAPHYSAAAGSRRRRPRSGRSSSLRSVEARTALS